LVFVAKKQVRAWEQRISERRFSKRANREQRPARQQIAVPETTCNGSLKLVAPDAKSRIAKKRPEKS
jgi:hypothetical protein